MTHGSLESGLGGFDLAAEMMGWKNVFHCEINPFCRQILNYYWPDAESSANVFEFSGTHWRGRVDILTCGFPCQPFSLAGKGLGDKDDRFIWPENMRVIRECQPPYVVAENVPGLLSKHPLVFERVCLDLEAEGYEVQPFNIPACATEKDHIRRRIFFLAYNNTYGQRRHDRLREDRGQATEDQSNGDKRQWDKHELRRNYKTAAHNYRKRLQVWIQQNVGQVRGTNGARSWGQLSGTFTENQSWIEVAASLCSVDDGIPPGLDTKAISKARWRKESIMAFGNSIVWEIAYEIFKAIEQHELLRREGRVII